MKYNKYGEEMGMFAKQEPHYLYGVIIFLLVLIGLLLAKIY